MSVSPGVAAPGANSLTVLLRGFATNKSPPASNAIHSQLAVPARFPALKVAVGVVPSDRSAPTTAGLVLLSMSISAPRSVMALAVELLETTVAPAAIRITSPSPRRRSHRR